MRARLGAVIVVITTAGFLTAVAPASVATPPRKRRPTKPTYASKLRRLDSKTQRGQVKAARGKVSE